MKILFLDIDGVVNCSTTIQRRHGLIGIDPLMAFRIAKITLDVPDLQVVLSSSWRLSQESRDEVEKQVVRIFDITSSLPGRRGDEIKEWLDSHKNLNIEKYAILDDDADMLPEQLPHFFKTSWEEGITEKIAQQVTEHLKKQ